MSKRAIILAFAVLMALLLAIPMFAACAPQGAPAPVSIKVGAFVGLTGPASTGCTEFWKGQVDMAKYINDRGGIDIKGTKYKLDFVYWDSGYTVPRALVLLKKAQEDKISLLIINSSSEAEALMPMLTKAQIPAINSSVTTSTVTPPGWEYGITPGYPANFGFLIDWIAKNWKESRPANIGFCTWDNSYGRAIMTDECLAYAEKKGCKVVAKEFFGAAPTDLTPQLQNLQKAGVDFIFGNFSDPQTSVLVRQAYELGVTPKARLMGTVYSWEVAVLQRMGAAGAKAGEGWIGCIDTPWYTDTAPGAKLMNEMRAKYHPGEVEWDRYAKGMVQIAWAEELVKRAIAAVGIENVTGPVVKEKGFDTMVNWVDPYGFFTAGLTCSANDVVALKKLRYGEVKDGKPMVISDWIEVPPLGWGK